MGNYQIRPEQILVILSKGSWRNLLYSLGHDVNLTLRPGILSLKKICPAVAEMKLVSRVVNRGRAIISTARFFLMQIISKSDQKKDKNYSESEGASVTWTSGACAGAFRWCTPLNSFPICSIVFLHCSCSDLSTASLPKNAEPIKSSPVVVLEKILQSVPKLSLFIQHPWTI